MDGMTTEKIKCPTCDNAQYGPGPFNDDDENTCWYCGCTWRERPRRPAHYAEPPASETPTPEQITAWCLRWWRDDAWRKQQQALYGPDIAQHLRGIADMIEPQGKRKAGRA